MAGRLKSLKQRPAWKALSAHYKQIQRMHLRQLFQDDPGRADRYTVDAVGLLLDYSKNRITDETLKLLLQLAEESGLRERIDAMFKRREDQRHGEKGRSACGAARAQGREDRRRSPKCRAGGARRARQDGQLFRPGA